MIIDNHAQFRCFNLAVDVLEHTTRKPVVIQLVGYWLGACGARTWSWIGICVWETQKSGERLELGAGEER